jgi:hypothetical protein
VSLPNRPYDPQALLVQRIRSMATDYPLRCFLVAETSKIAIARCLI